MNVWSPCIRQLSKTYLLSTVSRRYISQSYYDILKIPQSCSPKDIRDAFITLSKQNHPDKHGNDPSMHEKFVRINEAYSVLINPSTRRAYDMTLGSKRKLNAPHFDVYTSKPSYSSRHGSKKHTQSSHSDSNSNSSGNDYFYNSWEKKNTKAKYSYSTDEYYSIKGVSKVSNSTIVLIVIGFTIVGGIFQWLAIQAYSKSVRDKMTEQSRKLSLLHSMAREKARLYGNEYQLDVLKRTLQSTYDDVIVDLDVAKMPQSLEIIDDEG